MTSPNYTLPEAADFLRCSTKTVQRRIKTGQLGCCRIGKVVIVRQSHLDLFLRAVEDAPWAKDFRPADGNPTHNAVHQGPRRSPMVPRAA